MLSLGNDMHCSMTWRKMKRASLTTTWSDTHSGTVPSASGPNFSHYVVKTTNRIPRSQVFAKQEKLYEEIYYRQLAINKKTL